MCTVSLESANLDSPGGRNTKPACRRQGGGGGGVSHWRDGRFVVVLLHLRDLVGVDMGGFTASDHASGAVYTVECVFSSYV